MTNDVVRWSIVDPSSKTNNNKSTNHNNNNNLCCQSNNNTNNNNNNMNNTTRHVVVATAFQNGCQLMPPPTTPSLSTLPPSSHYERSCVGDNDNDGNVTVSSTTEQICDAPPATNCDRNNFDRVTCCKANQSSFVVLSRVKTKSSGHFAAPSRTNSNTRTRTRDIKVNVSGFGFGYGYTSGFYRILFLCLQLCAILCSVSRNIGFACAQSANSIDNITLDDPADADDVFGHYTHTWAVHIPNGDKDELVERVARDHGFVNLGKIFDDHYHFAHHKVSKRSLAPAEAHQSRLDDDTRVQWAKQQRAKSRSKRDLNRMRPSRTSPRSMSLVDAVLLDDPKWPQMWYLNRGGGLDMNVIPAWKEGITGKGVVVTILDDGLESNHPDIEHNYDPLASYDVNSHDDDPMPHYDLTDSNRHGTRCAGEVAATANNSICAVGIAFGASVGGVRMLDGDVTDAVEARSLSLNPQHIDIYSASWGPDDDGKTVDGPGELASRAFIEGVTKGRRGKGSIFIWASGNGGREMDNCNCDGYTNSIWTLSISSATEEGHVPWYSEKCSSTLATTYSSGSQGEKQVVTTDLHHSCTVSHTGTSASAPLAAGIAALVLESNGNLTWRDLQHIVVRTAKPANLKDPTWSRNGVGRRISHSFGYGLMDAAAMVRVARTWKTVPEQQRCEINAPHVDKPIPAEGYITLQLAVKHCQSVNYLEHVQAKITLASQRRGDIQLFLRSPAGTKVTLLTSRAHDSSRSGFNQWPFMSVHTWGESPHGNWQLEIHNEGRFKGHAQLREWSLIFYGTTLPIDPNDPVSIRRNNIMEITTPNSPSTSSSSNGGGGGSTTTTLHQIYSPLYPRISPNNMANSNGIAKYPAKLPPNKSTYMNGNSANSTPNGSNNKKQSQQLHQGYQQISATYGVILGSQSKNSKNNNSGSGKGKGKNGENKKNSNKANNGGNGNGNGNGGGNNKSSSNGGNNKKNQSAIPTANAQKIKFYRILQELQGGGGGSGGTTTSSSNNNNSNNNNNKSKGKATGNSNLASRLAAKQQSIERFHSSEEKTSRKVIGDLPTATNPKIPLRAATVSVTTQATANTRLPVKSTKQVKEKPPQTPPQSPQPPQPKSPVVGNIPDQRIPKMFERYDKIQAIFPEFQPYQGIKEQDAERIGLQLQNTTAGLRQVTSGQSSSSSRLSLPPSKPSRENSKKSSQSFVPDSYILRKQQQLLLSAAAAGSSALREELSAENENENAQIAQWDLIFYGTETPAQPGDAGHLNTGKYNPYGGEMEHNDIEFDASGQWHNMQQIGESAVKSHDRTNTACTNTTIDQRCLVCAPPTFLYNGRCYDECPRHTFVVVIAEKDAAATTNIHDGIDDNTISKVSATDDDQLESTDKRRRRRRKRTINTINSQPRQCHICDASCYQCYGSLNSQCSTCYPGSQLRRLPQTNETFCYVFAERSSGNDAVELQTIFPATKQTLLSLKFLLGTLALVVLIISTVLVAVNRATLCQRNPNATTGQAQYSYDRVALLTEADDLDGATYTDFLKKKHKLTNNDDPSLHQPNGIKNLTSALSLSDSDEESEVELFTSTQ